VEPGENILRVQHFFPNNTILTVDLSQTLRTDSVPGAIGKFTQLQELNLSGIAIKKVPTEILLGCKHLKILDLSNTEHLFRLPYELGNLSELRELNLQSSNIRKLEVLDRSNTRHLDRKNYAANNDGVTPTHPRDAHTRKPQSEDYDASCRTEGSEQIDIVYDGELKLMNLRKLNLRHSALLMGPSSSSLPPLWKNPLFRRIFMSSNLLSDLDLSGAINLTSLPDVIRNLIMLKRLNRSFTDIATLPPSSSTFYSKLVSIARCRLSKISPSCGNTHSK